MEKSLQLPRMINNSEAFFIWSRGLKPENKKETILNCSFRSLRKERVRRMIENYLSKVAITAKKVLQHSIKIKLTPNQKKFENLSQIISFSESGCILVQLRVFQEKLFLLLPHELVHETNAILLNKEFFNILAVPNNEELTVFSYVIVNCLSELVLFTKYRTFLTTVALPFNDQENDNSLLGKEFIELIKKQKFSSLTIVTEIQGYSYPLLVLLSEEIVQRISLYGNYQAISSTIRPVLKRVKVKCKLVIHSKIFSILSLLRATPGKRFQVGFEQDKNDQGVIYGAINYGSNFLKVKILQSSNLKQLLCVVGG